MVYKINNGDHAYLCDKCHKIILTGGNALQLKNLFDVFGGGKAYCKEHNALEKKDDLQDRDRRKE